LLLCTGFNVEKIYPEFGMSAYTNITFVGSSKDLSELKSQLHGADGIYITINTLARAHGG